MNIYLANRNIKVTMLMMECRNPAYINSQPVDHNAKTTYLLEKKWKMIIQKFCSKLPEDQKQQYIDVLLKDQEAISKDKV